MELKEAIRKRRSVRVFADKPVEKDKILKLLDSANYAPSACNFQAWKFIIIDNQEIKNTIYNLGGSILIKSAPSGILVLYDNRTTNYEYNDDLQSASAAIQNILLRATELGLGSCWVCHLPRKKDLRKLLNIPKSFSPIAYILLGYPKNSPQTVARINAPEQIMHYNSFHKNWQKRNVNTFKLFVVKILMKLYYVLPYKIKKRLLNKFVDKYFVKKFKN